MERWGHQDIPPVPDIPLTLFHVEQQGHPQEGWPPLGKLGKPWAGGGGGSQLCLELQDLGLLT